MKQCPKCAAQQIREIFDGQRVYYFCDNCKTKVDRHGVLLNRVRQTESELEAIIEHSGEGIAVVDHNKQIIIWNKALERLTGISSTEAIGQGPGIFLRYQVSDSCPLENRPGIVDLAIRHCQTKARRFVSVLVSEAEGASGQKHRAFLFRDMSRSKELEEAKSDFISLATHQLRTPLTAILGYLSLLSDPAVGPVNLDQKRYLERIGEASRRLSVLIEDLLHVLRLEENRLSFKIEPIAVPPFVEEVVADFRQIARQKNMDLKVRDGGKLGIFADSQWLKHALVNLVDNAVKYTSAGGKITVSWEHGLLEGRTMGIIHVHDTGIGIAIEEQRRLFQKFGRLSGNPVNVSGTGLGLYIAKQLVEKQGGTIWVKSTHRKGSTFSLAFPLAYRQREPKPSPLEGEEKADALVRALPGERGKGPARPGQRRVPSQERTP